MEFPSFIPCYFPMQILCANQMTSLQKATTTCWSTGVRSSMSFLLITSSLPLALSSFPKLMDLSKGSRPIMIRHHVTHTRVVIPAILHHFSREPTNHLVANWPHWPLQPWKGQQFNLIGTDTFGSNGFASSGCSHKSAPLSNGLWSIFFITMEYFFFFSWKNLLNIMKLYQMFFPFMMEVVMGN